jgi:cation diffusion facilitator family transporter
MAAQMPPTTRSTADHEKRTAAGSSVLAAIFLTTLKLVVGLLTGSLGILAEAAHSALDLVAAVVTFLAVRVSGKPPDQEYTYGRGKVENLSALLETVLLVVTCAWIIYEAIQRLFFEPKAVEATFWAFAVMAISIVVDVSRSRMLYATARKHHSQALEADALHFSTDVWSSSVVILGLALVWLGQNVFPQYQTLLTKADAVAALGVAFIVLFVSYELGRRTIDVLLDRAPVGLPQQITQSVAQMEGVLEVSQVRVRRSGPRVFVDMNVAVDRNLSFEHTHAIASAIEAQIQEVAPDSDVVVHTDPHEDERESVAQRIRTVASRNQLAVHNISVHQASGQLYVDMHLEVDDHLSLRQAHNLASHIEQDLRADMPDIAQVTTHIESRGSGIGDGDDVTVQESALVEQITAITDDIAGTESCHEVTLRRLGKGYAVAMHCTFDDNLPITEVHAVASHIEARLQESIPSLQRVLVHAEPRSD